MKLPVVRVLVSAVSVAWLGSAAAPEPQAPTLYVSNVLAHLARSISWYRQMAAVEQSGELPDDVIASDNTQRISARALQLAFDFARAAVPLVQGERKSNGNGAAGSFNAERASARAVERIAAVEARIAEVDAAAGKAGARAGATLSARRKELQAELNLAKAIQESLQRLRAFMSGQSGGGSDLPGYIDRLERSVPEAMRGAQTAAQPAQAQNAAATLQPFRAESAGIVRLVTETIGAVRGKKRLGEALAETEPLRKNVDEIRAVLVAEMRDAIRRSDEAAGDSASQDAGQMDADRREVEALTARFKQVSAALIPLREQGLLIDAARGSLLDWRNRLEQRYTSAGSYLLFRILALIVTIAVVLAISELWRRGTFRYVRDARRRKQFLVMRRVVVGFLVATMAVLGMMSELGSLATYAGFLTAGLAVALQNVILSVVAYFFLIGRYGLRVGDRVTISGVTGDVLDIGLVRIHLMELTGTGWDLQTSGRVVAFSNSVVFQPAALFKQLPGTEYVWHTVALTLAADTPAELAEERLMAAVGAVYEQYRERIEQQHAALERVVDIPLASPQPQGRLRFTDAGLEFHVRYPAELRRASATDDQVIKALSDAIAREPGLRLAGPGSPKLVESAGA